MATKVTDTDHGYRALCERVFGFGKPRVDMGILERDGGEPHGGVGDALTVLEVAIFNEFGTENIPARSFIRAWFDEQEADLRRDLSTLMRLVVAGKQTKERILELLAQKAVGEIQARIAAGIGPANAPSTIARKGSSTPLVDTGVLRSSVSYRVDQGK